MSRIMSHPFDYAWALLKQWEDLPENWGDEPPPEATPWEDLPEDWGEPSPANIGVDERREWERRSENYAPMTMQPTPDFHTPPQHKMPPPRGPPPRFIDTGPNPFHVGTTGLQNWRSDWGLPPLPAHTQKPKLPSWWGKDGAPLSFQDTYDPDTGWDMP